MQRSYLIFICCQAMVLGSVTPPNKYTPRRMAMRADNIMASNDMPMNKPPNLENTPPITTPPIEHENNSARWQGFNADLREALLADYANKNLLYSPVSLHTMLSLIYLGTEEGSSTASELEAALHLSKQRSQLPVAAQEITARQARTDNYKLILANKLYHKADLTVKTVLKNLAHDFFQADIEDIDFTHSETAAKKINKWVRGKTMNLINSTVTANDIAPESTTMVINTVYMKAKWQKEFSTRDTFPQNFHVEYPKSTDTPTTMEVSMMYVEDDFRFANFSETLHASIVEMPFKDTNTSMYIVLPNAVDGLTDVEERLRRVSFSDLVKQLKMEEVTVRLPRFQIETDIDLIPTLKKLNIRELFTASAKLGELFTTTPDGVGVSQVQQKAFLKVNEGGIEAAAASFGTLTALSLTPRMVYFTCDHPFIFLIAEDDVVFFTGHVVRPELASQDRR